MASIASNALRVGTVFEDGDTFVVLKYQHIKKGRGQATIRVKVRNIETGSITEKTYTNEQKVEAADVEKRSTQFLYSDDAVAYFMDNADYSQFELSKESISWALNFLKEGDKVVTTFLSGRPVGIEAAKSAELVVTETSPAVAGNTATNATKVAILETGYSIQVPLFIAEGEKIRVNTEEGTYVSRA
jgi:elongation factor P